jgi:Zinc-finger associated domain (zf-AD)
METTTVCFACLRNENKESCRNVFASNGKLAKDIYTLTNLVISDTESALPATICATCTGSLEKALNFRLQLSENFEKFKKMQKAKMFSLDDVKMEQDEPSLIISSIHSDFAQPTSGDPLIIEVLTQINQSIKNLSNCYDSIDGRLRNIENTLAPQEVLHSFTISPIGCDEEFDIFLNMLSADPDFRRNLVSFLVLIVLPVLFHY